MNLVFSSYRGKRSDIRDVNKFTRVKLGNIITYDLGNQKLGKEKRNQKPQIPIHFGFMF